MELIDSLLDQSMEDVKDYREGSSVYDPNAINMSDPEAKIRLSHSTLELLHGCERKFQKIKLLENNRARDESPAMSFGKAYGQAAQLYMILRTEGETVQVALDSAIFEGFLHYAPFLEDDRRFLERLIYCLTSAVPFHEKLLMDWEIASFNGKYATELNFRLNISKRFYFVGAIDLVLRHRRTGRYAITDYKTTSIAAANLDPLYKNSDQTLGYSIVLDAITGQSLADYDVNYWVVQLSSRSLTSLYEPKFHDLNYPKTLRDRFEWFLKIHLDVSYIESLEALEVYPKRNYCMSYNKVCPFFNECQFSATDRPAIYIPDDKVYDFTYNLEDVFEDHRRRLVA